MKRIPMTSIGSIIVPVTVLMEMDDVLDARMVSGLQIESSSAKMDVFKSTISGTASTTRSQSAQSARSVESEIRNMLHPHPLVAFVL